MDNNSKLQRRYIPWEFDNFGAQTAVASFYQLSGCIGTT